MNESKFLLCFDRDGTVSTGNGSGPVPIEWVRYLAHETHHQVWATGNQHLRREADIRGFKDIDVTEYTKHAGHSRRVQRLRAVRAHVEKQTGQEFDRIIVVDDVDVSVLEEDGWEYFEPQEFVEEFRSHIDI